MERSGVGQPVRREEDPFLLRGRGRFIDDVKRAGATRAYFLRSPHANARITSINCDQALMSPGVTLILTGNDTELCALGTLRPFIKRKRKNGTAAFEAYQPWLAKDTVRFVGEPVACVIAESLEEARGAAELIEIDYDPLPPVTSLPEALRADATPIWADCPDNIAFHQEFGDSAALDKIFSSAEHVVRQRLIINRVTAATMEPRGCVAEFDERDGRYILQCGIQIQHRIRVVIAQIFHVPESEVRIIAENVGGSFGMKAALSPEFIVTLLAARRIGRPVKWIADRSESMASDEHARDFLVDAELALDGSGTFLGLRVRTAANIGAYHTSDRPAGPALSHVGCLSGTYTTPAFHVAVSGVMTNTQLVGHYRGAGRPEYAYIIEAMIDVAARKIGMDKAEIRRRNTIPAAQLPYRTPWNYTIDCGDFLTNLEQCLKVADYDGFEARRTEARRNGKIRGIGVTNTLVSTFAGALEFAELRFDQSGMLTLFVGTHDHGQGHGTSYKQIISDLLGVNSKDIRFKYGDTDTVAAGTGSFGSRSMVNCGGAIRAAADKIIAKGTKVAAHLLEASERDIAFEQGEFKIAGTDKAISLADIARASFIPAKLPANVEPGLYETGTYSGPPTYPNGCHICEVEIDAETGAIEITGYHAVDDVGRVVNPLLVEGQTHGGIVQAIGQCLSEDVTYDSTSGQLLSGSFMDYGIPRATAVPKFHTYTNEVVTKTNPLGVKGAGEGGAVGALTAVMNAINDALASVGTDYVDMPCTPNKVWEALKRRGLDEI